MTACRAPDEKGVSLNDHVCWIYWELDMEMIGAGGKAFDHIVQEPRETDAHNPADPASRDALAQQLLNHPALLVRDDVVFGASHKLASAYLALMMLFTPVNMAVFLELWRSTLWARISDDYGCCWPP
jgi:hypothetical protein